MSPSRDVPFLFQSLFSPVDARIYHPSFPIEIGTPFKGRVVFSLPP